MMQILHRSNAAETSSSLWPVETTRLSLATKHKTGLKNDGFDWDISDLMHYGHAVKSK